LEVEKMSSVKRSYGIACCRYNQRAKKIEVLLIHKRVTYSFVDFVLGRYKKNDERKLCYLFERMTAEEKLDLCSMNFGQMWYRIWLVNPDFALTPEDSRPSAETINKYNRHKSYFHDNWLADRGQALRRLLTKVGNSDSPWEIPKGRVNHPQERGLNCSSREFQEETGIPPSEYELLQDEPFEFTTTGGDVTYKSYIYLALLNENSKFHHPDRVRLNYHVQSQIAEVIGIRWMDLDQVRAVDGTRRTYTILVPLFKILQKKYKIRRMTELDLLKNSTLK
jgi:8-oxo-dGTP pyrophosphatase MutT (NUDIX family)